MAAQTFGDFYSQLISDIYGDDMQSQRYYQSVIETQRNIPVDYLLERGCLFVPNNDYIAHYAGAEAKKYHYGIYAEDRCLWTLFFLFPILDLSGDPVGLVGWDAQNKYLEVEENQEGLQMYRVSSKKIFDKDKYFLADIQLLKATFDKRVILVTDGVFDSIALNYRGIPCIALLGSTFSREILYFLRWYRYIYIACDNDSAGIDLYKRLKKALPCVYRIVQNRTKDIEELLRADPKKGPITQQLLSIVRSPIRGDLYLKL